MKGIITYIEGHKASTEQAKQCLESYLAYGWEVSMVPGIVPETLDLSRFPYPIIENGILQNYVSEPRIKPKMSCLHNDLSFCEMVLEADTPLVRLEQDSLCIAPWNDGLTEKIRDLCFLSIHTAFKLNGHLTSKAWYTFPDDVGIFDFPEDYPLLYPRDNVWKGAMMVPGTAAYILTPSGASKILEAAKQHGLDQSDFIINSKVLDLQYVSPSVSTYNKNLALSHGFTIEENTINLQKKKISKEELLAKQRHLILQQKKIDRELRQLQKQLSMF